jgi:hypothetical protein
LIQVLGEKFDLSTNGVLTEISVGGKAPEFYAGEVQLGRGSESERLFQESIEGELKKKHAGQPTDTRIGIVQGSGQAGHMYITYKDMDGVWRTMDIYLSLADKPGGGLPYSTKYATKKQWHKLVTD